MNFSRYPAIFPLFMRIVAGIKFRRFRGYFLTHIVELGWGFPKVIKHEPRKSTKKKKHTYLQRRQQQVKTASPKTKTQPAGIMVAFLKSSPESPITRRKRQLIPTNRVPCVGASPHARTHAHSRTDTHTRTPN